MEEALALLRGPETDIGEKADDGNVVVFGVPHSPLLRVPPARLVARSHPPIEVKGAGAVSRSVVSVSRVTKATRFCSLLSSSSSSELSTKWSLTL